MIQLIRASQTILNQISFALKLMTDEEFVTPSKALNGSSVGQHLRHTLEFFICLEQGLNNGVINYDKRDHDRLIETEKEVALAVTNRVYFFIDKELTDKALILEANYTSSAYEVVSVNTSYFRELTYNIEHAVHHMAIMKIGIGEVAPHISLPSDFGVAESTIRHREKIDEAI